MFSIPALTGIRAIAAGAVFFGHVLHDHLDEALSVFKYGWIGVNMFFAQGQYIFLEAISIKAFHSNLSSYYNGHIAKHRSITI
jgi:peptidoglycan/LPS O-acetylase OafA/YrhL